MQSFEDAMAWASRGQEHKCALLLGNGFSMAYDPSRFSYGALATLAEDQNLLPLIALTVMKASGTSDFEALMNRPGFDAAIFCEKDSDYAQAVPARSP